MRSGAEAPETESDRVEQLDGIQEEIRGMVDSIEDTLTAGYEKSVWEVDKDKEPLKALRERLTDLIDEYERLAADADDESAH